MNQTIAALSLVGICAALCELLLPQGQAQGTKRALRVLVSLAVLLIILRPFLGFLRSDATLDLGVMSAPEAAEREAYEEIFESTVAVHMEADFKAQLIALLEEEYGIAAHDVAVHLSFDAVGELCQISIYLSGAALLQDPHALAAALTARLGYQTEVR